MCNTAFFLVIFCIYFIINDKHIQRLRYLFRGGGENADLPDIAFLSKSGFDKFLIVKT